MRSQFEQLKKNLKGLRARTCLSQDQVSKELNISRTSFNEYENNPSNFKVTLLLKLANVYECKVSDFFIDV